MNVFFKMALLSFQKHLKRSLLIIMAIMASVFIMEFLSGMMEGMRSNFFTHMLQDSGHIQVTTAAYQKSVNKYSLDHLIHQPDPIIAHLKKEQEVTDAEKILYFGALLKSETKSLTILGVGISNKTRFFKNVRQALKQGSFLPEKQGILISHSIAALLDLKLHDQITVLVADSQGDPWYENFAVSGIFDTGDSQQDENYFYIQHAKAQELLDVNGETTQIRLLLKDPDQAAAFAQHIKPYLEEKGLHASTWQEIYGSFIVFFKIFDLMMIFINIIIVLVVATVITNAILMNVFEKTREYGTLRAIGLKKRALFLLVLWEGGVEGVVGSLLGLAIGIPVVLFFQKHGLDLGNISEFMGMGSSFAFAYSFKNSLIDLLSGILIALVGSLFAAYKTTKLKLIETLRFV